MYGGRNRFGYDNRRRNRGSRGTDPMFVLLMMQLANRINQLPYKPPFTIFLIGLQVAIHIGFDSLLSIMPLLGIGGIGSGFRRGGSYGFGGASNDLTSVCLIPNNVIWYSEWPRLFTSTFYHADGYHLYYNMGSLLVKGVSLEHRYGTVGFAVLVSLCVAVTPMVFMMLSLVMANNFGMTHVMNTCTVGFSGVLFALKVVVNHLDEHRNGLQYIYGFQIPTKYSAWAELVLIYVLFPGSSFIGHLSGIITGMVLVFVAQQSGVGRANVPSLRRFFQRFIDGNPVETVRVWIESLFPRVDHEPATSGGQTRSRRYGGPTFTGSGTASASPTPQERNTNGVTRQQQEMREARIRNLVRRHAGRESTTTDG